MNPNGIITLTTDFGTTDIFVGVMKGVILNINPEAKIIDITHDIKPQDVCSGAFLLNSAYRYFPAGTIHMAVIDPGVGSARRAIAVETERYYFVAPDNGLLSYVLGNETVRYTTNLTNPKYFLPQVSNTFHGRDIFAPVAAHISRGVSLNSLGEKITNITQIPISTPHISESEIIGKIIYIDRFGNLITNISYQLFESVRKGRSFTIFVKDRKVQQICRAYTESSAGEILAIFSSFGNLEIAINERNAAETLGVKKGEPIRIQFKTERTPVE